VLLSPACASYDQFPNFEVRGDSFRKLVQGLPAIIAAHRGGKP
jgi:UDP-N-acetylmuramoylalanine--D-glutamate ligase